jgi:hypothetical protein
MKVPGYTVDEISKAVRRINSATLKLAEFRREVGRDAKAAEARVVDNLRRVAKALRDGNNTGDKTMPKTKMHNNPVNVNGYWTGTYLHRCGHSSPFSVPVGKDNQGEGRTIGRMRQLIRREAGMDCLDCRVMGRGPGRPTLGNEPMERVTVSLPKSVVEELRADPHGLSSALRDRLGL